MMDRRVRDLLEASWPIFFLIIVNWVIRYWYSGQFGFYEDDHHFILRAIEMDGDELRQFLFNLDDIFRFRGAGHPLHPRAITILSKLGWSLGKLQGLYWLSFVVGSINITLFYSLMRRVHSAELGFVSGIMYVLFFADTTQAYLTYSFGLQPSITLLLLASHSYLRGNRWLPYILSILILLTYETVFPVFFAIPLLEGASDKTRFQKLLRHIVVTAIILAVVIFLRTQVGESRIEQLTLSEIIRVPLLHSVQGPLVSIGTYFYRPIQTILSIDPKSLIRLLLFSMAFFVIFAYLDPPILRIQVWNDRQIIGKTNSFISKFSRSKEILSGLNQEAKSLISLAMTGGFMLILAYPLTFTVRAYAISGRETRVHAAGAVGAAILFGSLLLLVIASVRKMKRGQTILLGLGIWLGALASFGFIVQKDYALAWQHQKRLWTSLVPFVPDVSDGTVILVTPDGLQDTRFIAANTWSLRNIFHYIVMFPSGWTSPPRVYRLHPDWKETATVDGDTLNVLNFAWINIEIPLEMVIMLDTEDGVAVHRDDQITIGGVDYPIKRHDPSVNPVFELGELYPYFIESSR